MQSVEKKLKIASDIRSCMLISFASCFSFEELSSLFAKCFKKYEEEIVGGFFNLSFIYILYSELRGIKYFILTKGDSDEPKNSIPFSFKT